MRRAAQPKFTLVSVLTLLLVLTSVPAIAASPVRRGVAEDMTFRLVNCMRTGGNVTASGKCRGWGTGRYSKFVQPLRRSDTVSKRVSWPWARRSVQFSGARSCWIGHARSGSTVDRRFAGASLKAIKNGENMGCGTYGGASMTALRVVRMWQSERAYGGVHWRQIKDPGFKSVGVGVAKYGSRKAQVVVNFYGKVVD